MVHVATRVCSKMRIPQSRPCMFSVGNVGSGSSVKNWSQVNFLMKQRGLFNTSTVQNQWRITVRGLRNAATSSSYALGIFVNNWAAGYLTSAVVQIIIQDMSKMRLRLVQL